MNMLDIHWTKEPFTSWLNLSKTADGVIMLLRTGQFTAMTGSFLEYFYPVILDLD